MGEPVDVDQLIEEGLSLYGQGNLDGALALWEQVLEVDPNNDQAVSYVEYVKMTEVWRNLTFVDSRVHNDEVALVATWHGRARFAIVPIAPPDGVRITSGTQWAFWVTVGIAAVGLLATLVLIRDDELATVEEAAVAA